MERCLKERGSVGHIELIVIEKSKRVSISFFKSLNSGSLPRSEVRLFLGAFAALFTLNTLVHIYPIYRVNARFTCYTVLFALVFRMAPTRSKKTQRLSQEKKDPQFPVPSKTVAIQSPARTPTQSPTKRPLEITQGQKQALIDNLQLEGMHFKKYNYSNRN